MEKLLWIRYWNRRLALVLCVGALFSVLLTGCGSEGEEDVNNGSVEMDGSRVMEDSGGSGSAAGEEVTVRIGSMKGPTTIGLLSLMEEARNGAAGGSYEFTMVTAADELLSLMMKGELDIALVPANMAGILYQKSEGGICVIDINTLGVLYMVSGDTGITSMEDLKGRTVYLTGKGTTPDYCLKYLLSANGIQETELTLEYRSEATEVAALLAEYPDAVGLLPQPFVTAACTQNEKLSAVLDMMEEWSKVQGEGGSSLVTGVTVVQKAFLETHGGAVDVFLSEHKKSAEYVGTNVEETAKLAVEAGIIAKEPLAVKAIPECNVTYVDGGEMKKALSGYLDVLFGQNPEAVGGSLPDDSFYYTGR